MIYYLKPPVISFGIVFPLFFYLAFAAGRSVPTEMMVPGIVAMALFFTASAIGPAGDPVGKAGADLRAAGDLAGFAGSHPDRRCYRGHGFGALLSFVPLLLGTGRRIGPYRASGCLIPGLVLGALAFSAMGC